MEASVVLVALITEILYRLIDTKIAQERKGLVIINLQRETDTADWSTPTFTLPCPKNGGVYPATSTFPQN